MWKIRRAGLRLLRSSISTYLRLSHAAILIGVFFRLIHCTGQLQNHLSFVIEFPSGICEVGDIHDSGFKNPGIFLTPTDHITTNLVEKKRPKNISGPGTFRRIPDYTIQKCFQYVNWFYHLLIRLIVDG